VSFTVISADVDPLGGSWHAVPIRNDLFLPSQSADILPEHAVDFTTNRLGKGREVVWASRLPSPRQRVLFCRCGSTSIYVRGHCQRCYHRERADRKHFAGLREQVLARDEHRCRGCQAGSIHTVLAVHHRQPGSSSLELLVTLCPACHAVVERTQVLFRDVPELLRVLWRELHPAASEQMPLFAL
jgi:5-methylcytosine-specific restriction endonuclease McrA